MAGHLMNLNRSFNENVIINIPWRSDQNSDPRYEINLLIKFHMILN